MLTQCCLICSCRPLQSCNREKKKWQKVKLADLQIDQLTGMKKHANLTRAEIKTLPDNNTHMFILPSKEDINTQLTDKHRTVNEIIKELEVRTRLEFAKRHLKDSQTMRNKIIWSVGNQY
uniref:Uncharacterized protein n=1 Tax=Oncorhynchus tshawytscha TaxID=74940 RepID=A0AAZ3PTV2_ONCTS